MWNKCKWVWLTQKREKNNPIKTQQNIPVGQNVYVKNIKMGMKFIKVDHADIALIKLKFLHTTHDLYTCTVYVLPYSSMF